MTSFRLPCLTLAMCAAVVAHATGQFAVAPTSAVNSDANGVDLVPGAGLSIRWMTILDASYLPPGLAGQNLTGIWFRRNALSEHAFDGGSATVTITLSHASRSAASASHVFDANHHVDPSERILVYQGLWTIPASSSPATHTVDWSNSEDIVGVSFAAPFAYLAGSLCVEIVAERSMTDPSGFWNMDAVLDTTSTGTVVRVGTSCIQPTGQLVPRTASIDGKDLVAGSTAGFVGIGVVNEMASLAIGFNALDLDLTSTGLAAPGCRLRVDPTVNLITSTSDTLPWPGGAGRAYVPIELPSTASVLGVSFVAQFIQLSFPLATSEALHCTIAPGIPTLGASLITASIESTTSPPMSGEVRTNRAPVIRFGL